MPAGCTRPRRSPLVRLLMLLLALGLCMARAVAQPIAGPAPAAPVAVHDIVADIDAQERRIASMNKLLVGPDPAVRLQRALDEIAVPVNAKLSATAGVQLRGLPVMRLESLARHWQFDARRIEHWKQLAQESMDLYSDGALQLARDRNTWLATRAQGIRDGLPQALSVRVDEVLSDIDTVQAALNLALARQFDLQQRAAQLAGRVEAQQDNVMRTIDAVDRRLLSIDAPPIWHGIGPNSTAALDAMRQSLAIEDQFAIDYHAAGNGNQQALRVVQLLLLLTLVWLAVRSRHGSGAGAAHDAPEAARALRRPVSAWLLLSMISVLTLEADAPLLVQECALLIALVPVARLLPTRAARALGPWMYPAIVLYGLDRLSILVLADSGWYRLLLLVLNLFALCLAAIVLHRLAAGAAKKRSAWQKLTRAAALLASMVLLVALIANTVGNVSLAETLVSGVIDGAYMAVLLYAGVNASAGIVRAVLGQPELARTAYVRRNEAMLQIAATRLLVWASCAGWLLYTASQFRILRPALRGTTWLFGLGVEIGEISIHLGDILVFLLGTWFAFWTARAVRRLLRDELHDHAALPRGVGNSIASFSYYGVLLLGSLFALSAAGVKLTQLAIVFGALGVGIGFGLQNVVNNFVSGLVLMVERPIQPGDVVDAAGASGTVRQIGLRATTIRTFEGADVVVPNGQLLGASLTNWTMFDHGRRLELSVRLAHGAEPARVLALLGATASETPGVLAAPAPDVQLQACDDDALVFVVRAWVGDIGTSGAVRTDLFMRMLDALARERIALACNKMEVLIQSGRHDGLSHG